VGRVVFTVDSNGVFTLQSAAGTATDLCAALGWTSPTPLERGGADQGRRASSLLLMTLVRRVGLPARNRLPTADSRFANLLRRWLRSNLGQWARVRSDAVL